MESSDLFTEDQDSAILKTLGWWESRRLTYNSIVGITGLIMLAVSQIFTAEDIFWILVYAVAANICYSAGFLIEMLVKYYSKGTREIGEDRKLLYVAGIILSILLTIGAGIFRMIFFLLGHD